MKDHLKLFVISLTITLGTFTFADKMLFPPVNATYVEGAITQDTVWTLVDSPYVVSKNVTVCPNATLTIEPEVKVKFGGKFSLIVEGRLVAQGAKDKAITFTSNKDKPEAGNWAAIEFKGTQPSSLIYCTIEYGTNGIIIENGTLNIRNSLVRLNSENGIMITNGTVEVKDNEIGNNTISGICIAGGNWVDVQNNNITSNGDGITLTGNLTAEINISHNKFLLNRQSGILLEANSYGTTIIHNNLLSKNSYGFYVSSNASTYITRNYISNNTVGIFYEKGEDHTAYFNDIYDNSRGMNVSSYATVNAEYNYWGDRSGPYHESLNPRGTANPVGGDGVNLDFIFFLTASIDYNNMLPTSVLWTDKTLVAPNQNVTFIGTDSYDDGRVDQYFFDFGDGTNSSWTTLSLFAHNYSSTGTYNAKLTVMDDFGDRSESSVVAIDVQNLTPLEASITLSNFTVNFNEQILVTVYVSDGIGSVENVNVTLFAVKGGSFTPLSGLTNPTGYFAATFTAPDVTELTDIRIIARASKAGYADGSDHKYLKVLPPLTVQVTAEPSTIKSEEEATVTAHVTDSFEQPVPNVLLILEFDHGNLSATIGVTDLNGNATFLFNAPQTMSQVNATIMVTAIKMGYVEGHCQGTIVIEPKILVVEVTADPLIINSEAISSITAHVTYEAAPISNATIKVSSDSGGNFSATTETTDSDGNAIFVFTAPQTTMMLETTITVKAARSGYAMGEAQTEITIVPKVLAVKITAEPNVTISEAKVNVTFHVTHAMIPVPNANVTVMSDGGDFSPITGLTDAYGDVTFIFTAYPVNIPRNVIIIAQASKIGHVNGENQLNLIVNPGILNVEVEADPSMVVSGESNVVTVYVRCNATPVADALVTVFSSEGDLSPTNGITDSNGMVSFVFDAPSIIEQLRNITITATATKDGYASDESQLEITLSPRTFNIQVDVDPTRVMSEETATVTIYVKCKEDATSVADAIVTVSSTEGSFYVTTNTTDSAGFCTFLFNAPKATEHFSTTLTVNVTKSGYISGERQIATIITPAVGGGWPVTTILLIIIPIVIAVIVTVLIKLKIITIYVEEE